MGHAAPYDFHDDYPPAPGHARFQDASPPPLFIAALELGCAQVDPSLKHH